jgi:hypothetical protein
MHAIEYSYASESFSNIWTEREVGYELRNQNQHIIPIAGQKIVKALMDC